MMTRPLFSVVCLVLIFCIGRLSLGEYSDSRTHKDFSLFDDDDTEMDGDEDSESELTTDEEEQLLHFLESAFPYQSWVTRSRLFSSDMDAMDEELLDETMDTDDDETLIKLLKLGYRFSKKVAKRAKQLDTISDEFDQFVKNGFTLSNHWFNLLAKLGDEDEIMYEFRETILNMMAQAERNIASIHKVTGMYKELVIDDPEGIGKLETVPGQYNAIASLYDDSMDDFKRSHAISDVLESLKGDVAMFSNFFFENRFYEKLKPNLNVDYKLFSWQIVKKEKNLLRLFRIFMEEQQNLITLGKKLWVSSQMDYDRRYDDDDDKVEDLSGGLKKNPTSEDRLKQLLQVRRTRRAISAYSDFLKRKGNQNKTTTANKTKKDSRDEL